MNNKYKIVSVGINGKQSVIIEAIDMYSALLMSGFDPQSIVLCKLILDDGE